MNEISNTEDVLDVRDVIERFEELENIEIKDDDEDQEFQMLQTLLDGLKGNGGDEQWRGDWYPVILIRDSYFVDYCEELVSDIGDLPRSRHTSLLTGKRPPTICALIIPLWNMTALSTCTANLSSPVCDHAGQGRGTWRED